jgi:hypothetical protein
VAGLKGAFFDTSVLIAGMSWPARSGAERLPQSGLSILKKLMVEQLRASWNPLLSWLRDVQAWSLAA